MQPISRGGVGERKFQDNRHVAEICGRYGVGGCQQYVSQVIDRKLVVQSECAVFDFYNNLNFFYGIIAECCTAHSCPTMSAGSS